MNEHHILHNCASSLEGLRSEYIRQFNGAVSLAIAGIERECLKAGIASPTVAPKSWEINYTYKPNGKRLTQFFSKDTNRVFANIVDSIHEISVEVIEWHE